MAAAASMALCCWRAVFAGSVFLLMIRHPWACRSHLNCLFTIQSKIADASRHRPHHQRCVSDTEGGQMGSAGLHVRDVWAEDRAMIRAAARGAGLSVSEWLDSVIKSTAN
jgi:hypothetical protein